MHALLKACFRGEPEAFQSWKKSRAPRLSSSEFALPSARKSLDHVS